MRSHTPIELETADEIIDVLGGTSVVAKFCRVKPASVSDWRRNNAISPRFYLVMAAKLAERGCTASPVLWKIKVAA